MNNAIKLSLTAILLLATITHANTSLEDITVTTTNKLPTSIKETSSNVSVITEGEIKEKGYQTVAQAISGVSGITVSHSGGLGQSTSFFMRGSDAGKVLVLLDGMRLNDPSSTDGRAFLDSLTTSNIQQIEIVKGGSSSIWGSNASAGVINIITKEAKDGVHGSLGLSYGSYNTKGADAALSYKDEKLTAQVLASYLDTDSFSALVPRDAEKDGYTNKNLNLKLGYIFDDYNTLNLSYNIIKTETEFDDTFSMAQADDDYSHGTSDQSNIALDYLFSLGNYSAIFHASKGEYDRDYYTTGFFGDGHNVYKATLKEYALINGYNYTNGKAVLGLEYKDIDGFNQYNNFPESQSDYNNKAVYLSNVYDINENTLIETNLRYDDYSEFDNKTTYKIGVKHLHHFLQGLTSSANYYTSYDAPSSYQLANTAFGSLLKPSYTKGFDITVGYKKLLQISYFNNKVKDSIDYISDPVTFIGGYTNIDGTSKFSGIEIESEYVFTSYNIILSANYTHLFDFEKEDGSDLPRRAKDTLNASVSYYTQSDMHFGLEAQYIGDRLDTDGGFPIASDVPTGNYTVWNLNFSTKLLHDIDLSIHAKNIFDKEYQSVYNYAAAGRSAYAKLTYSF
ncbi:TonB-dependent receptor plug domain-containing protein [Sulfurovum sp.]|uniref:TonB-dependent receptor plug domain-containing protein n=1 Tax=Sulfurovum sp. TaxID=1969726 RepID=UPI002867FD76|nr:TonB-dependent receptor plug domain-containing protein [Sulfurovum sp.]